MLRWLLLKSGQILSRDAVKHMAVRGWLLLEKTSFDQSRHGLRNFGRPLVNACIEHPPVQDAVDGVLRIRMPGEVIQNFGRGRWERRVGWHTLERSAVPLSTRHAFSFRSRWSA